MNVSNRRLLPIVRVSIHSKEEVSIPINPVPFFYSNTFASILVFRKSIGVLDFFFRITYELPVGGLDSYTEKRLTMIWILAVTNIYSRIESDSYSGC